MLPEPQIYGKDDPRNKANFYILGYKEEAGTVYGQMIAKDREPTEEDYKQAYITYKYQHRND